MCKLINLLKGFGDCNYVWLVHVGCKNPRQTPIAKSATTRSVRSTVSNYCRILDMITHATVPTAA
jgi:hypothetical protein